MPAHKANIAVLVSGGGTNLQALLDAQGSVLTDGRITLVVSDRAGAYALERARAADVKAVLLEKKTFDSQKAFETALQELLEAHCIDLIVLAGFLSILGGDFTARWPRRILNVHPSLIPAFCGAGYYGLKVHRAVLEHGVKVTGATVHYVNEIPDGGEILLQKAVRVYPGDTPERLQRRVMRQAEWKLLPQAVQTAARRIAAQTLEHSQTRKGE